MHNFIDQAKEVLKQMQKRDYQLMDFNMNCAKDVNLKDLTFGRVALQIPQDHYEVLTMIFPDIQCADAEIKTQAWKAFCIDEISTPYKTNIKQRTM